MSYIVNLKIRKKKTEIFKIYYAPHSSPEGARRFSDRSNACGALVFSSKFYTVLKLLWRGQHGGCNSIFSGVFRHILKVTTS